MGRDQYVQGRPGGLNERLKIGLRPENRLIDTTQTARKGSEIFIRNTKAHDPSFPSLTDRLNIRMGS